MGQGTKVPPCHWVLFTLILSLGTFGSEGKKFQQKAGKSHEDNRDTNKWIPLPRDLTPGAQKEFALFNQKGNDLPIRFGDQALTKMPRDEDLVHKKKSLEDGILKRRHGLTQVDFHPQFCFLRPLVMFESENSEMIFNVQAAKASSRQDQGGGIRTIAGQSPSDFAFSMAQNIGSTCTPEICCFT